MLPLSVLKQGGKQANGVVIKAPASFVRQQRLELQHRSSQPVSYTHLDVYKRQGVDDAVGDAVAVAVVVAVAVAVAVAVGVLVGVGEGDGPYMSAGR